MISEIVEALILAAAKRMQFIHRTCIPARTLTGNEFLAVEMLVLELECRRCIALPAPYGVA